MRNVCSGSLQILDMYFTYTTSLSVLVLSVSHVLFMYKLQLRTEWEHIKPPWTKKRPNQPSFWIPNCMGIQSFLENVTKRFLILLLIITAFAVKKNQGSFMIGDLRLTGKCHIHYNCHNVDATFRRCKPTVYFCKLLLQEKLLRKWSWFSVSCKCYRK